MLINCDIGERGAAHRVDDELMRYIDIANIACGGHAGDFESTQYYKKLAKENDVKITAHLSYPDKENFGRKILNLTDAKLLHSFDEQYTLIDDAKAVKLHGALYNQANIDAALSKAIVSWFTDNGIKEVLTQQGSELDLLCKENNIEVIYEAFLDRRYIYEENTLKLSPRSLEGAVIHDPSDAKEQFSTLKNGYVMASGMKKDLLAKTLCVHSDSPAAIDILKAIQNV